MKMRHSCHEKYICVFTPRIIFPNKTDYKIKIWVHGTVWDIIFYLDWCLDILVKQRKITCLT